MEKKSEPIDNPKATITQSMIDRISKRETYDFYIYLKNDILSNTDLSGKELKKLQEKDRKEIGYKLLFLLSLFALISSINYTENNIPYTMLHGIETIYESCESIISIYTEKSKSEIENFNSEKLVMHAIDCEKIFSADFKIEKAKDYFDELMTYIDRNTNYDFESTSKYFIDISCIIMETARVSKLSLDSSAFISFINSIIGVEAVDITKNPLPMTYQFFNRHINNVTNDRDKNKIIFKKITSILHSLNKVTELDCIKGIKFHERPILKDRFGKLINALLKEVTDWETNSKDDEDISFTLDKFILHIQPIFIESFICIALFYPDDFQPNEKVASQPNYVVKLEKYNTLINSNYKSAKEIFMKDIKEIFTFHRELFAKPSLGTLVLYKKIDLHKTIIHSISKNLFFKMFLQSLEPSYKTYFDKIIEIIQTHYKKVMKTRPKSE